MVEQGWPPDPDSVAEEIVAQARRPVVLPGCFVEWVRSYWMDSSDEEALRLWEEQVRVGFWHCAQDLRCLDALLADPPEDLVELIRDGGGYVLYHRNVTPWREYSREDYLAWLRRIREEFGRILDARVRAPGSAG